MTERKRIASARGVSNQTELAFLVTTMEFDAAQAVNIHGLNVTMGMTPVGPDESLVGRWYVVLLSNSIASDATLRNAWIANLNTVDLANVALSSSEFVWGAGSIVCAEQSTFQHSFSPKSSRNAKNGAELFVIMVADAISGVIDDHDMAATISLFTN